MRPAGNFINADKLIVAIHIMNTNGDLARIDLNLLRIFEQVMRQRRVSHAAAALGLSQPAVSNALRRLRGMLGDELFVHTPAGMAATAYALRIAPAVTQALALIDTALAAPGAFEPARDERSFTLAMTDVGQIYFLPVLMQALAREAPGVTLRTTGVGGAALADAMAAGHVHLALGWLPDLRTGFYQQALFRQGYVCLMRRGHPALAAPLDRAAFLALDHVHIEASGTGHAQVDEQLARRGLRRRIRLTVPDHVALGYVLAGTDLVATVPERFAARVCDALPLAACALPVRLPPAAIQQVWHARAHRDPAHQWLRALVARAFGGPGRGGDAG